MATIDSGRGERNAPPVEFAGQATKTGESLFSVITRAPQPIASESEEALCGLLDRTAEGLQAEWPQDAALDETLHELFLALRLRRNNSTSEQWDEAIRLCRRHPVLELLHQDPFTHRAFSKPRGYAGDAEMMDYIYGREENWPPPDMTPLGRRVFEYTTQAPASEGVRARRGFIANLIDRLADERPRAHLLAIAAGHLREAQLCAAVRRKKVGRYVALDVDGLSLAEVDRCYGRFGVETVTASFGRMLTQKFDLGSFDLVYSTGLFDYLSDAVSRRLASAMFQRLRPGGSLVVANFLPGIRDVGYMEAFMDWRLIYRTRQEMISMTMDIPQAEIRDIRLFAEENQNILFLQVTRA